MSFDTAQPDDNVVDMLFVRYVDALSKSNNVRSTIMQYLVDARQAGLAVSEAVDLFCVSTPSIIDESSLDDDAREIALKLLDELLSTLRWD